MKELIKNIIANSLARPAFLLTSKGEIFEKNGAAHTFLEDYGIYDSLKKNIDFSKDNELSLVLQKYSAVDNFTSQEISLIKAGKSIPYKVNINPLSDETERFNLISIEEFPVQSDNNFKYNINVKEIEHYMSDRTIISLFEKIKSSYPFTFIGKQKFQREIDSLDRIFLLKDPSGLIVSANKKFSEFAKSKINQIHGKNISEFYNAVESEVINNADSFIMKTGRPIIYQLSETRQSAVFVEAPLVDMDGKIVALVCFSSNDQKPAAGDLQKDVTSFNYEHLNEFNEPILILSNNGAAEFNNEKYGELFLTAADRLSINESSSIPGNLLPELNAFLVNAGQKNVYPEKIIRSSDNNDYRFRFNKIIENDEVKIIIVEPFLQYIINNQSELKVKMYDLIMHTSPEPMIIYDIESLKFLEVNHAALKMYGYTRDEFLEMDLTDLYAPEDIQTLIESSPSKTTTSEFTGPWRHKRKNGKNILVEISKSTLEFGGKRAHFNIIRNVTDYVEEKKKMQILQAAYENSLIAFVITDSDGFIESCNEFFINEFGYDKSALERKPFLTLVTDEDRANINSEIFHSGVKSKVSIETRIKKSDRSEIPVNLIADPILDYKDDISAFQVSIQSLRHDSYSAAGEIESAQSFDASFLSNLFHEILTPINVITGFVQELAESLEHPTKEQKEAVDYIKDNQQLLLQIMDNAAEYTDLEQNAYTLKNKEIVFVEMLETIETNVRKVAKSEKIEITYGKISSSLKFKSDAHKFESFVTLLVIFGLKVTKNDKIFLSAYQSTNDRFYFCIRDERDKLSDGFSAEFEDIFVLEENTIKQRYGISRFTIRLAKKLFTILDANRKVLYQNDVASEYCFEFPLILDTEKHQASVEVDESNVEVEDKSPQVIIEDEEIIEPPEENKESEPEIIVTESESQIENDDTFVEVKEEKDHPVPVISDSQSQSINVNVNLQPATAEKVEESEEIEKPKIASVINVVEKEPQKKMYDESEAQTPQKKLSELTCLYVEDQLDSQILFKVQMKDLKSIEFAASFEKALPLIQLKTFDFMVMDINLQGEYNGLDALRAIQKMPGLAKTPIIAVTAYVLPGDREKFIAAGFTDFISKPILRDKLENVLGKIYDLS